MNQPLESLDMGQDLDRDKIRALRKALGLSQTEAAEAAGFSGGASQWSDIENGRRESVTLATLAKVALALKVDARDLITAPEKRGKKKG